jgi:hypothetical protein
MGRRVSSCASKLLDGRRQPYYFTNPNTCGKTKIKTLLACITSTYTWRSFAPEVGVGDMASIGAFLYLDNTHELDFEVGCGRKNTRNELEAEPDDLIVYMTSQKNPFLSYKTKIKRGQWHTFLLKLTLNSRHKYKVSWNINSQQAAAAQLTHGKESEFNIYCSTENLTFSGDHIPYTQNYALFDFVEYSSK